MKATDYTTRKTTEIQPIAYEMEDENTLYIYDANTTRPIWYRNGKWFIDLDTDYAGRNINTDDDAERIEGLSGADEDEYEEYVNKQLEAYGLKLGEFHDWNEYDLIEI